MILAMQQVENGGHIHTSVNQGGILSAVLTEAIVYKQQQQQQQDDEISWSYSSLFGFFW